ncbi:MAG: site-2 protease family protein, partial [Clostridia bacterium]
SPDAENPNGLETYNYGFTRQLDTAKLGFFRSLGRSFTYSFFIVFKILALLGALITGKIGLETAGGPITVISTVSQGVQTGGFPYLIYITCILSANLAVMNLLPLPALDGSKIVFTIIEWIRKKPINRKVEAIIHTVGLVLLFTFTIFVDIFHLLS